MNGPQGGGGGGCFGTGGCCPCAILVWGDRRTGQDEERMGAIGKRQWKGAGVDIIVTVGVGGGGGGGLLSQEAVMTE